MKNLRFIKEQVSKVLEEIALRYGMLKQLELGLFLLHIYLP